MELIQSLKIALPLSYALTFYFYLKDFKGILKERSYLPTVSLIVTTLLHIVFLAVIYFKTGILPIGNLFGAVTSFVLIVSVVYLFIEYGVKDRSFGIFVLPLNLFLQIIASIFIKIGATQSPLLEDLIYEIHVISFIVAFAALSLSAIAAIMHLLLSAKIKKQELDIVYHKLPTLQFLHQVIVVSIYFGFILLAAGVLLGFFNAAQVPDAGISYLDPKILSVLVTLLIYGYFIIRNMQKKLSTKLSVYLSLTGFLTILFTFFVVNILMTNFHLF